MNSRYNVDNVGAPGIVMLLVAAVAAAAGALGHPTPAPAVAAVLVRSRSSPRVPTRIVVKAMYDRTVPRVRLDDGTLGIPADALDCFQGQAS